MIPPVFIHDAAADGVCLTLSATGTIKATGDPVTVTRWLPLIREHKHDLMTALRAANDELLRLVPAVVRASGGDPDEEVYCLNLALADPIDALQCYRLMADELGLARK